MFGFRWSSLLHPDDAEQTLARLDGVRQAGLVVGHGAPVSRRRWKLAPHPGAGVPVRNERGEITHWAGINLDISRLKRVEQSYVTARKTF